MPTSYGAISNWQEAIWLAGANVLSRVLYFLPSLVGAILIFIVGLVLARWGKALTVKILGAVKLDSLLRKSGLDPFLKRADIRVKFEVFLGEIIRWLIVLVLTIGVLLAGLVESLIKGAVSQIDAKTSRLLAKIGSYLVVVVSALAAVNELGIAQSLINTLFIVVIATLTLGLGLAIGLGAKDLVAK